MKVKDAMHKHVEWVSPDTPIGKIAKIMCDEDIGSVPIGENDRLVGMVTDRDITCRAVAQNMSPAKTTARDVMSKGIVYCRDSDDLEDALKVMRSKQLRRLPVIDANKRMVGILALGDISRTANSKAISDVMSAVAVHHA
jgi:predicted transcriptional regulator